MPGELPRELASLAVIYGETRADLRELLKRHPMWLQGRSVCRHLDALCGMVRGREDREQAMALLGEALAVASRLRERYPQFKADNEGLVEYVEGEISRLKGEISPDS
jgi:hypothetical protein